MFLKKLLLKFMLNIEERLSVNHTLYSPHRGSVLGGSILYLKRNPNLFFLKSKHKTKKTPHDFGRSYFCIFMFRYGNGFT